MKTGVYVIHSLYPTVALLAAGLRRIRHSFR